MNFSNILEMLINRSHSETESKINNALDVFSNKLQGIVSIALPKK